MKYFSTFSGIGAFEQAVKELNLDWVCVGYSEIDKHAIKIYEKHFPNHKNFGDITKIDIQNLPDFNLIVGGSPCQDLSLAKKNREGLNGEKSGLFYKFLKIIQIKQPKYFLLENVNSMSSENKNIITRLIGVPPVMINASIVSAQNRKRLFWCNWTINKPEDKKIFLKDILQKDILQSNTLEEKIKHYINFNLKKKEKDIICIGLIPESIRQKGNYLPRERVISPDGKMRALSCHISQNPYIKINDTIRKLTPIEFERLQCFPDNYTEGVSDSQRYKLLGNAMNVEVIKHIIKCFIERNNVENIVHLDLSKII